MEKIGFLECLHLLVWGSENNNLVFVGSPSKAKVYREEVPGWWVGRKSEFKVADPNLPNGFLVESCPFALCFEFFWWITLT